jgi:hypothetical protein
MSIPETCMTCYKSVKGVTGVLRVLQEMLCRSLIPTCYKSVAVVLQECYEGVTRVLQECCKSVARVLQECYKSVTLQKHLPSFLFRLGWMGSGLESREAGGKRAREDSIVKHSNSITVVSLPLGEEEFWSRITNSVTRVLQECCYILYRRLYSVQ